MLLYYIERMSGLLLVTLLLFRVLFIYSLFCFVFWGYFLKWLQPPWKRPHDVPDPDVLLCSTVYSQLEGLTASKEHSKYKWISQPKIFQLVIFRLYSYINLKNSVLIGKAFTFLHVGFKNLLKKGDKKATIDLCNFNHNDRNSQTYSGFLFLAKIATKKAKF